MRSDIFPIRSFIAAQNHPPGSRLTSTGARQQQHAKRRTYNSQQQPAQDAHPALHAPLFIEGELGTFSVREIGCELGWKWGVKLVGFLHEDATHALYNTLPSEA